MKLNYSVIIGATYQFDESIIDTHKYIQDLNDKVCQAEGSAFATLLSSEKERNLGSIDDFMCSVILFPKLLRVHDNFYLDMIASISLCNAINEVIIPEKKARIKWPNLICIGKHEIGSVQKCFTINQKRLGNAVVTILIKKQTLEYLINGIQKDENISNELLVSSYENIVKRFFERLTYTYYIIQNGDVYQTGSRVEYSRKLYKFGIWSSFKTKKLLFLSGKICEVDSIGRLKVLLKDGSSKLFEKGEIDYLE